MKGELVGGAVLPAREGWWPVWVRRLLGRGRESRRQVREIEEAHVVEIVHSAPLASPRRW